MSNQKQKIKVLRAFFYQNKLQGVGSVLTVDLPFARELAGNKKAEYVQSDTDEKTTDVIDGTAAKQAAADKKKEPAKK